jgi:hypothetical protein
MPEVSHQLGIFCRGKPVFIGPDSYQPFYRGLLF